MPPVEINRHHRGSRAGLNRLGFAGDSKPREGGAMTKTSARYSPEALARAVCMALDLQADHASKWAAVRDGRRVSRGPATRANYFPSPPENFRS